MSAATGALAVFAMCVIALADLSTNLMFTLFSQGVDLSIGSPAIRMGGIVLASLGVLVLREGVNLQYGLDFCLRLPGYSW